MAGFDDVGWSLRLLGGHPIATLKTNISTSAAFSVGTSSIVRVITASATPCWAKTSSVTPATAATTGDMYIPGNTPTHIAMNKHKYLSIYTGSAVDVYVTQMGVPSYDYEGIPEGTYKNNG